MPEKQKRIAVVGGANMDIGGFPSHALVAGDSNPGRVRMSPGGVGRNIAENAARLGLKVELVTALGEDANGRYLLEDGRAKGIGMDASLRSADENTSVYLFLDDSRGDMHCAINDMQIQTLLTPQFLETRLDLLNSMDAVVLDANLPEESIHFLARELKVLLFADAVSAAKVVKLRGVLDKLYCLKPNRMEAELLTGIQIRDALDAYQAARKLVETGVKRVFLTMGAQGALCVDDKQSLFLPGSSHRLKSATGAGDAFTAALVWAHCEGMDLRQSGIAGMAGAEIAMSAMQTVNPAMSRSSIMKKMADITARL